MAGIKASKMCVGETFPISYIRIYVSNFQNYTKARN
jgi:hypothetical protein